jgi:hypothetical protein
VGTDKRPDPGAVHVRHGAEVNDDVALAVGEVALDRLIELLGRAVGDQRLARRDDQLLSRVPG